MKTIDTLAIDLGASNGRGIIGSFDGKRVTLTEIHRFANEMIQVGPAYYWDILRLYQEIKTSITKAGCAGSHPIASLGIDGWAQDFGLLDGQGNLIGNVHTYRDSRWEGMQDKIAGELSDSAYYRITGMRPGGIASLFQLLGMREKEKTLYEQAKTFLFVPDLLNYFLTGEKACNSTLAGLSGLYDIGERGWSESIGKVCGFNDIFPRLTGTHEIIGNLGPELAEELSAGKLPVIAVAAHDTMTALAFAPGRNDQTALLSSGTWSVLGCQLDQPFFVEDFLKFDLKNEVGFDHEILLMCNITGLWIVQELLREWYGKGLGLTLASLDDAFSQSGFTGSIDVNAPEFAAPGNMEAKIRNYLAKTGQPVPDSPGDFYRCVLVSLAAKYKEILAAMTKTCSRSFNKITIVGGGSRNEALNQLIADTCQLQVSAGPAEASAFGNILCQLIALGELKNADEARQLAASSFEPKEYLPQPVN